MGWCILQRKSKIIEYVYNPIKTFARQVIGACRDVAPIILVVVFFQLVVLRTPFPDVFDVIFGLAFVVIGLTFFVLGLEYGLFPIGEAMAEALALKGSLFWLLFFGFGLGFSTTVAEPALIAVAKQGSLVMASGGFIESDPESVRAYVLGLRFTVALSVGFAIAIGLIRILKGWPLHYLIIGGYVLVTIMTFFAPKEIVGIAYDSGGVTTSTVTVPLVTALGVGLASAIHGRNPLLDGFGLIAFASLMPMIFVMVYGMVIFS
ncbi:MAG: DUF1538 domain-containing protein [Deltaproteobacteria bacterium]|nr:DUF1538 domain-containing protein [Deltaproteobacteria bacterium]